MSKRCPFCRESLRSDAAFCRYCNRDLEDLDLLRSRQRVRQAALGLVLLFGLGLLFVILGSLR